MSLLALPAVLAGTFGWALGVLLSALPGRWRTWLAVPLGAGVLIPARLWAAGFDAIGAAAVAPVNFLASLPAGAALTVLALLAGGGPRLAPVVRASGGSALAVAWHAGVRPRWGRLLLGWVLAIAATLGELALALSPPV